MYKNRNVGGQRTALLKLLLANSQRFTLNLKYSACIELDIKLHVKKALIIFGLCVMILSETQVYLPEQTDQNIELFHTCDQMHL